MYDTWGKKSKFDFVGDVSTGTTITYGRGHTIIVSAEKYDDLRKHFLNQVVAVGSSSSAPGGLGEWLKDNVTKTRIASYVAAILEEQGYAVRVNQRDIRIIK